MNHAFVKRSNAMLTAIMLFTAACNVYLLLSSAAPPVSRRLVTHLCLRLYLDCKQGRLLLKRW